MSRRETKTIKLNKQGNERNLREHLSGKINTSLTGLWFLIPEYLRLGAWDLAKGLVGGDDKDINPRLAMQLVNESALCKTRIRKENYINSQGFEAINGLSVLASDQQIHNLLNDLTMADAQDFQQHLMAIRNNRGHFESNILAIDPHRIKSTSSRTMQKKKKKPDEKAQKLYQTFFCNDVSQGQPLFFASGASGKNTTKATIEILENVKKIRPNALIIADKEHFTTNLFKYVTNNTDFELLVPAISRERIKKIERKLSYKRLWAGYAVAETNYKFGSDSYRLVVQRSGEAADTYVYKSFLTISKKSAEELMSAIYDERWSIEEFFNFDGEMGFDRASTFNMNIRHNKMSLALLAQAATYELRKKLPKPYKTWKSSHLSDAIFRNIEGDIRVEKDTIIVTCYNAPKDLNLPEIYQNLPKKLMDEGIDPRIPWLFDFKLDFRFK